MTAAQPETLIRLPLRVEQDIFVVRQLGREVARAIGLESQDEIRVATALSEVARLMLASGQETDVAFVVRRDRVLTFLTARH